jgi:hypothetical protein
MTVSALLSLSTVRPIRIFRAVGDGYAPPTAVVNKPEVMRIKKADGRELPALAPTLAD